MTAPRRDRGRPPTFDDALRKQYLDAVTEGMRLGDAAAHFNIHRNLPTRTARTNPAFAAALKQARELGKKARDEQLAHDESRYNHHKCRCRKCCAAVTAGRRQRRHAASEAAARKVVVDLPAATPAPTFPLARAS